MKYVKLFLVLIAVVSMTGCAITVSEGLLNLDTFSKTSKGDTNSAIAKQRARIAQDPNNAALFAGLSYLLSTNGQYDEAIAAAKRAIGLNPSSNAGFNNLGYAYQGKGQYDDALKAYEKAIAIAPSSMTYHLLGTLHWVRNDYAKAVRSFKKASAPDAKNDADLMYLAMAYFRTGEYDDALSAIDKAIDLKNYGTMGMRLRVKKIYDIVDRRDMIVVSVEKGGPADKAGIKVGDGIALILIEGINVNDFSISLYQMRKQLEEKAPGTPVEIVTFRGGIFALPKKRTIILERFKDPALSLKLGIKAAIILARTGNTDEALKYATESLDSEQSKSSESWAKVTLGRIHIGNGNYDEAINLLSGVVKSCATARLLEATAYAKQGDLEKAVDIYSAIPEEKLSPKNVPIWSDRSALLETLKPFVASKEENARTLQAQGRYREALAELGDATKVADDAHGREVFKTMAEILRAEPQLAELPEEARKYVLRGDVLTEEGGFEEAVKEYRKAVQAAPYIAKLHFNTAMVYGEIKRYPQAIRYMKTYLLLAPEAPNTRAAKDQIYKWEFKMEKGE